MDEKDYMDGEELEEYEKQRADENNAKIVSNAADVAIASGNPYAMAAGAIVKVGDSRTDGHVSKTLGKATTVLNKHTTSNGNIDNSLLQKKLNDLSESGTADKIGTAASIYSMGKGGAGGASKGAEAASKASQASEAASKSSNAAQKAEAAASKAKTAEQAAEASKKANEAMQKANDAKSVANEAQRESDFQKREEVKQKTHNKTTAVNKQTKNPYEEVKRSDERNAKEIIEDKVEEKEAKEQSNPDKPRYEEQESNIKDKQLDKALDIVDVAVDVADSSATKIKKWIILLILAPVLIPVILAIFIIMVIGSIFGADLSIGPKGNTIIDNTPTEETNSIIYTYPNNMQISLNETELIAGIIYYDLHDQLGEYYNELINMETLYEVYGTIYKLNLINSNKIDSYTLNYEEYIYCNTNGCYEIEDDNTKLYVEDSLTRGYTVISKINILTTKEKELLLESTASGIVAGSLISEQNKNPITINEDLREKIINNIKLGLTTEEILTKLGLNCNIVT